MSDEQKGDKHGEDMNSSPDSSFEILTPHDPTLSRFATALFRNISDYLQEQVAAAGDNYALLEDINRLVITKYADLRRLAENLIRSISRYDSIYENNVGPVLSEIDDLYNAIAELEENVNRLDAYIKQLRNRVKDVTDSK